MDDEIMKERLPLTAELKHYEPKIVLNGDLSDGMYRFNGMALPIDEAIELYNALGKALNGAQDG